MLTTLHHPRRALFAVMSLFLIFASAASAQGRGGAPIAPNDRGLLRTFGNEVALAEQVGARIGRTSADTLRSARRCVDATGMRVAKSGEFSAGSFAFGALDKPDRKLWWMPNRTAPGASFRLHAAHLEKPDVIREVNTVSYGLTIPDKIPFFRTIVLLDIPGPWLITVESGTNWGCFLATV